MDESVMDAAGTDAAGTETSTPGTDVGSIGGSNSAPNPGETQAQATARQYSESQMQSAIRGRLEQQKRAYEKRIADYERRNAEYEAAVTRMNSGIEAMGRGFGFIQDKQPEYVTADRLQQIEAQFDQRLQERLSQVQEQQIYGQIQNHWAGVQQKYAEWVDMPGFKDAWAKAWDPNKDPNAIAANIVSAYEKRFAARSNVVAEKKDARIKTAPVKTGGGTATGDSGDEKVPMRQSLRAALRASRES